MTTTMMKRIRKMCHDHGLKFDEFILDGDDFNARLRMTVGMEFDWWSDYFDADLEVSGERMIQITGCLGDVRLFH